jgi:hypothetical protein
MNYDSQPSVLHGGVHTILLDKVKKETINLAGDHIVRVTGRASPYNINRLTLYTTHGPSLPPPHPPFSSPLPCRKEVWSVGRPPQ